MINYHKIILNLRSYALMPMREISDRTGIAQTKLHRISNGTNYRLDLEEIIALTDLHLDSCEALHDGGLLC